MILAVAVIIFVEITTMSFAFAVSVDRLDDLQHTYNLVLSASDARAFVVSATLMVEQLMGDHNCNCSEAEVVSDMATLKDYGLTLDNYCNQLAGRGSWSTRPQFNVSMWSSYTESNTFSLMSFHALCNDFARRAVSLGMGANNFIDAAAMADDVDVRFILDNGKETARLAFDYLVQRVIDDVKRSLWNARQTLRVLLPVTTSLVLIFGFTLFGWALVSLRNERRNMLQVFFSIPKKTVLELYTYYNGHCADSVDMQESPSGSTLALRVGFDKRLILRFSVGLLVVLAFIVAMGASGLVLLRSMDRVVVFTGQRLAEVTLLRRCHVLALAALNRDAATYGSLAEIQAEMKRNSDLYRQSRQLAHDAAGDDALDLCCHELFNLLVYRECSSLVPGVDYGYCAGLEDLDNAYLAHVLLFRDRTIEQLQWVDPDFSVVAGIDYNGTFPWHREASRLLVDYWVGRIRVNRVALALIFALSFPAAFLVYALLHSPLLAVKREHQVGLRILLLIPEDVIEECASIKSYLESGKPTKMSSNRHMQRALAGSDRVDRILHAAADAIIVYNAASLAIEVVNPAAEALIGSAADIVGQPLTMFLPGLCKDRDFSCMETTMLVEGKTMPVVVSRSSRTSEGDGAVAAVVIWDVRAVTAYRNLETQNAMILQKMFPNDIAPRFRDALAGSSSNPGSAAPAPARVLVPAAAPEARATGAGTAYSRPLIADYHETASVLYASFVGLSETIERVRQSVPLVNALVCKWDKLAANFGVEKIRVACISPTLRAVRTDNNRLLGTHIFASVACGGTLRTRRTFSCLVARCWALSWTSTSRTRPTCASVWESALAPLSPA
eukprot:TRINITY_DN1177_c0_g1_i14.p1 TRINITY_DN1177_c0_g1~~TRINITY_DN1177_c0_g1_i14.p1  ORF type:complete len:840 (-),score=173.67 TRINITY_DN1177_c0_g1_i14:251-2770(-)